MTEIEAQEKIDELQNALVVQRNLRIDAQDFHNAAMIEAFNLLGIDHDEYRFKWLALEIHNLKEEHTAYKEVYTDHQRLVRELDVLLNGDGAAPQASLCDIVAQVKSNKWILVKSED